MGPNSVKTTSEVEQFCKTSEKLGESRQTSEAFVILHMSTSHVTITVRLYLGLQLKKTPVQFIISKSIYMVKKSFVQFMSKKVDFMDTKRFIYKYNGNSGMLKILL